MKIIKFLLLLSLLFNIAHASVIAMEDDCHHNTVTEYLMEQNIDDECGDICDMDHLFHFIAILSTSDTDFETSAHSAQPIQKTTLYYPPFKENTTKPPIV
jgi:hypothetical protein